MEALVAFASSFSLYWRVEKPQAEPGHDDGLIGVFIKLQIDLHLHLHTANMIGASTYRTPNFVMLQVQIA